MGRRQTIRGQEISRLLNEGVWIRGRYLNLCYRRGEVGKECVLVGRKLGNAVVRNRVKRRIREIGRKRGLRAWEIAFCPKPKARDATYRELEQDVLSLLGRAGINDKTIYSADPRV